MSLSRLAKECRECSFVDTCEHKQMEAFGVLTLGTCVNVTNTMATVNNCRVSVSTAQQLYISFRITFP